jgi:hypothetical protein
VALTNASAHAQAMRPDRPPEVRFGRGIALDAEIVSGRYEEAVVLGEPTAMSVVRTRNACRSRAGPCARQGLSRGPDAPWARA